MKDTNEHDIYSAAVDISVETDIRIRKAAKELLRREHGSYTETDVEVLAVRISSLMARLRA